MRTHAELTRALVHELLRTAFSFSGAVRVVLTRFRTTRSTRRTTPQL